MRTNLLMAPGMSRLRTLLVTSSEQGEGKTMAAANLAVSLARLNQRVLLIDADLRRPRLHQVFGVEQEPGLADVLTGRVGDNPLQETKVAGLWVMPSGKIPGNPTDLLGSNGFGTLIGRLQEQFDWVLLDSPPALAVTDPCLLARAASGVVFVVACGQTSREKASAAVERLEAVGANFVGAVLEPGRARTARSVVSVVLPARIPGVLPSAGQRRVGPCGWPRYPSSPEFAATAGNSVPLQELLAPALESAVERQPSKPRKLLRVEAARRRAGGSALTEPPLSNPWEV